ncbi:MAG: cytidine deaminase [Bacteroidales bacterium]|nr:cytidine deaminase [Bacteroidales bacterium]
MEKKSLHLNYTEFNSLDELKKDEQDLLAKAHQAVESSYAPYSKFHVGAAVLLEDDTIVLGSNQENAAYPSGLCAERVALFAASAQYPKLAVVAIAVTVHSEKSKINEPLPPCGACRQVMSEYEYKGGHDMKVILQGESGKIQIINRAEHLLPLTFNPDHLK